MIANMDDIQEFKCEWLDQDEDLIQIELDPRRYLLIKEYGTLELTPDQARKLVTNLREILGE